jgi:hypothetical protein
MVVFHARGVWLFRKRGKRQQGWPLAHFESPIVPWVCMADMENVKPAEPPMPGRTSQDHVIR